MAIVQEHQAACSAAVAGAVIPGLFDKFDPGSGVAADGAAVYNAGGMADGEALPGVPKTDPVKIARAFRGERDAPLLKWLRTKINQEFVIGVQWLNPDKSPIANGLDTYRGILAGVGTPTHDSNGTAVTTFELTMTVTGLPS